jgi:hypothetical protein
MKLAFLMCQFDEKFKDLEVENFGKIVQKAVTHILVGMKCSVLYFIYLLYIFLDTTKYLDYLR